MAMRYRLTPPALRAAISLFFDRVEKVMSVPRRTETGRRRETIMGTW